LGFGFGFGFGSGLGLGLEQVGYAVLAAHAAQPLAGIRLARGPQWAQLAGAELGRWPTRLSRLQIAGADVVTTGAQVGADGGLVAVDGWPLRLSARHHARLAGCGCV